MGRRAAWGEGMKGEGEGAEWRRENGASIGKTKEYFITVHHFYIIYYFP